MQRTDSSLGYRDVKLHVEAHSPRSPTYPHSPTFSEADDRPQKSLNEKQQENQELLIRCISQRLGFSGNRPIAACVIYKCLLQWRSFEVERTNVFDRIIQTIGQAIQRYLPGIHEWLFLLLLSVIKKSRDNNDMLSYWLSNASALLFLLQRTLKASGAAGMAPLRLGHPQLLYLAGCQCQIASEELHQE
ncbi:myosin-11-like [Salvia divinorum]|uniref:Myosin-11-like n=1 Tax=Salvia divinorum TaxID=28513 RepID=A0ABD1GZV5_SALDI